MKKTNNKSWHLIDHGRFYLQLYPLDNFAFCWIAIIISTVDPNLAGASLRCSCPDPRCTSTEKKTWKREGKKGEWEKGGEKRQNCDLFSKCYAISERLKQKLRILFLNQTKSITNEKIRYNLFLLYNLLTWSGSNLIWRLIAGSRSVSLLNRSATLAIITYQGRSMELIWDGYTEHVAHTRKSLQIISILWRSKQML